MWVQNFCKKSIPLTWEKAESLYDNLSKRKLNALEFNGNKGWFDNLRKIFSLKCVKITGKEPSAGQEAADEFLDAVNKIIEEKDYLPEQIFYYR